MIKKSMCIGIAFDEKGSWSFDNNSATNVAVFSVDNSLSSHTDNWKNKLLVLGEDLSIGFNGSFGAREKKFSINFSKAKTQFCVSLHYNSDNSYLLVNGKEIYKFKASNKNVNLLFQFCLGNISNEIDYVNSEEVSLKGNIYDFSVDFNAIHKYYILNIHKYLS